MLGIPFFRSIDAPQGLGKVLPDHFLFPACEASHFDPEKAPEELAHGMEELDKAMTCPTCGTRQNPSQMCSNEKCKANIQKVKSLLVGLRFHDLRHHAITELAESQASDSTIMAIAGHVSPNMLQHYSHVRLQAKRTALDALSTSKSIKESEGKPGSYDTNNDTKPRNESEEVPQMLENMVELVGIEPTTSSLRTMRSPS